jgi:hypothetical protein
MTEEVDCTDFNSWRFLATCTGIRTLPYSIATTFRIGRFYRESSGKASVAKSRAGNQRGAKKRESPGNGPAEITIRFGIVVN